MDISGFELLINGLKIIDVIKGHVERVVTGKRSAIDAMAPLVRDVQALLR